MVAKSLRIRSQSSRFTQVAGKEYSRFRLDLNGYLLMDLRKEPNWQPKWKGLNAFFVRSCPVASAATKRKDLDDVLPRSHYLFTGAHEELPARATRDGDHRVDL